MSSWINKLERRLEPFAIANISLYIVIAQVFVLFSFLLGMLDLGKLVLVPALVMNGEIWRLFTFLAMPPPPGMFGYIFTAFAFYIFYLFGSALEDFWGTVRYNLFLLIGSILTVGVAFMAPSSMATNMFLGGSVFLAFAFLNPEFVINLFLIIPVRIKWLALIAWIGHGFIFLVGSPSEKLGVLAATGNFILFFGKEIIQRIRTGRHRVKAQAKREKLRQELSGPMHTCTVCQRDSEANPELDFRYRTEGEDEVCYCEEHLPSKQG